MKDTIYRQDAIDAILGITPIRNTIPLDSAIFNIKKLSSAELPIKEKCCVCPHCDNCDVNEDGTIERKMGEWIPHKLPSGQDSIDLDVCSNCETRWTDAWMFNYCPNCGADMRGDRDE